VTTTFKRPGTYVEEVLLPQQVDTLGTATSVGAFVGASALGPTAATLVSSWTDFVRRYGSFDVAKWLHFQVYEFFANGGRAAYISRVVGSGSATATVTLTDRAGSPLSTLQVNAISPGAWANSSTATTGLYVEVIDNGSTDTFDLAVYQGGSTAAYLVERWNSVSMSATNARYVVSVINTNSLYIQVTNLNSATAAPNNRPAAAGAKTLTSGADGSTPAQADYVNALTQGNAACALDAVPYSLVLNIPDIAGLGDSAAIAVLQAAETYSIARGDVFVVADVPSDVTTAAGAISFASSVYGAGAQSGAYQAVYFPYIVIPDPITNGAVRTVAPGGAVTGVYLSTDATDGVQRAPAGLKRPLRGVVAPAVSLTNTDLDNMNAANPPVNAIRSIPGAGVCIMGARTLDPGMQSRYINIRRSVIYLKKSLTDATAFAVFENNDERLWERLRTICTIILTNFWQSGGLRGTSSTDAFYVKCDATTNSVADVAAGIVRIQVGVALQTPAEFILISIGQFQGGVSVSTSA
jgi:phage tail sheath protein FI